MSKRFRLIKRLGQKDGHRIFFDEVTSQLAIADNSGDTPDKTDDGVLFVDVDRIGREGLWTLPESTTVAVPLFDEERERSTTVMGFEEAFDLLDHLHLPKAVRMQAEHGVICMVSYMSCEGIPQS